MNLKKALFTGVNILKNKNALLEIINANIHSELIKKGEVLIPESTLEKQIIKYSDKDITIHNLICKEDHIEVTANIEKMMVSLSSKVILTIKDAEISKDKQIISFHVEPGKVKGTNLLGKLSEKLMDVQCLKQITSMLVQAIIDYVFKSDGSRWIISDNVTYSQQDNLLIVDVSKLEKIKKLSSPIAGIGECALDFVYFKAMHKLGGIAIKLIPNYPQKSLACQ